MSPATIRRLRRAANEDTKTFGARFLRSPRSVEDWEQGRRVPDKLAQVLLEQLAAELLPKKKPRRKVKAK